MSESFSKGINYRHIRWNFHKLKTKKKKSDKQPEKNDTWPTVELKFDDIGFLIRNHGAKMEIFQELKKKRVWAWILYSKLFRKEGDNKDVLRKRNYENYLNGNKGSYPNRK